MQLKIACISDTHAIHRQVKIEPCDIVVHSGDFSMMGRRHEFESFVSWFRKIPATFRVFIAGNHDWCMELKPSWLEEVIKPDENTIYLEDSGVNIMGVEIWGTPWQPEFHNWAFNLPRGKQLAEKYALIPESTNVLLSHGPPRGFGDSIPWSYVRPSEHTNLVGCDDLLARIKELPNLKLHVFGHIHQDDRKEITPETIVRKEGYPELSLINASIVNNQYDISVKPYYYTYEY